MSFLIKALLLYIPATYVEARTALGILSIDYKRESIIPFAIAQGVVMLLVRDVMKLFGPHVIPLVVSYVLLSCLIMKLSLGQALVSRALGMFLVMVGEIYVSKFVLEAIGMEAIQTLQAPWTHVLFGWLANTILVSGLLYVIAIKPRLRLLRERSQQA